MQWSDTPSFYLLDAGSGVQFSGTVFICIMRAVISSHRYTFGYIYELVLGPYRGHDLDTNISSNPLQSMAALIYNIPTASYLMGFNVWHERSVPSKVRQRMVEKAEEQVE